jgi:4-amino-4-deoxy-L-arabinose transferase-like glycosyltransferase
MPPLDRDESRFAQATSQMLETGDYVVIKFQDQPRFKKPVGIHWLQALSVKAFSDAEDRRIWAYRIPSCWGPCWRRRPAPGARRRCSTRAPA